MHDIIQHHAVSHCLLQVLKFRILTSKRALDLFSKLSTVIARWAHFFFESFFTLYKPHKYRKQTNCTVFAPSRATPLRYTDTLPLNTCSVSAQHTFGVQTFVGQHSTHAACRHLCAHTYSNRSTCLLGPPTPRTISEMADLRKWV